MLHCDSSLTNSDYQYLLHGTFSILLLDQVLPRGCGERTPRVLSSNLRHPIRGAESDDVSERHGGSPQEHRQG